MALGLSGGFPYTMPPKLRTICHAHTEDQSAVLVLHHRCPGVRRPLGDRVVLTPSCPRQGVPISPLEERRLWWSGGLTRVRMLC